MAVTTSTVSAPAYLQPAVQAGAQYLQDLASRPYTPYAAPRVAGASPLETQAFNRAANYQMMPEFGMSSGAFQTGTAGLLNAAKTPYVTPGEFGQGAQAVTAGIAALLNSGQYQPQQFSTDAANYYMDPYIQKVLDIQRREAETEFQKQQSALRARAASAGAFGGSRATLLETESQRNQNQLLDDMLAKGLSSAYTQSRDQFNRDQDQRLAAAQFGLQGAQSAIQGGNVLANIGQSRAATDNQALQTRQSALSSALQGAAGLAGLATNLDNAERARLAQLADFGLQQRQQQQALLDAQYQQFLDERDYPFKLADALTGGISRLQGNSRTETTTTPNKSNFETFLGGASSIAGLLGSLGDGNASVGVDFLKGLLPDNILGDVGGFLKGLFD